MLNNSNLYDSEWLAVVFSNRNKNYGAYVLRAQASSNLVKAFMIVAPLFVFLFVGPMIFARIHQQEPDPVTKVTDVVIDNRIREMEKPKEKEQPKKQEPAKATPLPKQAAVKSTAFTDNIAVVADTEDEPVTMADLKESVIASTTQSGDQGMSNALPTGTGTEKGTGLGTENGTGNNEPIEVGAADVYPEFPGGMEAWSKFIQKNLRYPYMAQDNNVQGKVFLSFVVEKDGSITDVRVVKGIGYGCDDEAVRVIKKSPRWKAGMQNKQFVRVRYNMPINYVMAN